MTFIPRPATGSRVSSAPTRPRFQSAPYRQRPTSREHIHGRIQPNPLILRSPKGVSKDPLNGWRASASRWTLWLAAFALAWFAAHLVAGMAQ